MPLNVLDRFGQGGQNDLNTASARIVGVQQRRYVPGAIDSALIMVFQQGYCFGQGVGQFSAGIEGLVIDLLCEVSNNSVENPVRHGRFGLAPQFPHHFAGGLIEAGLEQARIEFGGYCFDLFSCSPPDVNAHHN